MESRLGEETVFRQISRSEGHRSMMGVWGNYCTKADGPAKVEMVSTTAGTSSSLCLG